MEEEKEVEGLGEEGEGGGSCVGPTEGRDGRQRDCGRGERNRAEVRV